MIKLAVNVYDYTVMSHIGGNAELATHIVELDCPTLEQIWNESRQRNSRQTISLSIVVSETNGKEAEAKCEK